ncbi:sulfotransferase family protein [Caenorhabditis elegans]|uniref:Uncharacterized protein n=1 Tax=Caenorhabditis elegans TaxID=6239 RepID=O45376_CAEEL|nr:Uncharacterized protein CELE_F17B5.4 [Caenorhabditis elegans]CAB02972.3 Uncharacterized protein CELE_F17B5.4 [Caenorhabditis elegans]
MHKPAQNFILVVLIFSILFFILRRYYDDSKEFTPGGFIKPFVSYAPPRFFTAPKNNIIACGIRNSFFHITQNLMCLVYNETQYLADKRSFNDPWTSSSRDCASEKSFFDPSESVQNDKDTVRFAILKDPFQRFVTLYLNKCVEKNECYDCGSDMRCVVKKLYNSLAEIQNNTNTTLVIGDIETEAAPISWNCNFHEGIEKWKLMRMSSDLEKRISAAAVLLERLREQGVKQAVFMRIHNDIVYNDIANTTQTSNKRDEAEKQVREDQIVRHFLHKIYLMDYLVFRFDRRVLDPEYKKIEAKFILNSVAK